MRTSRTLEQKLKKSNGLGGLSRFPVRFVYWSILVSHRPPRRSEFCPARRIVHRSIPPMKRVVDDYCYGAALGAGFSGSGLPSQIFTVPSKLALARHRPSGLNATLRTQCLCPLSKRTSSPEATSHNLMVRSKLPPARRRPSGLKATLRTPPVCPRRERTSRPVCASQTFKGKKDCHVGIGGTNKHVFSTSRGSTVFFRESGSAVGAHEPSSLDGRITVSPSWYIRGLTPHCRIRRW